VLVSQGIEDGGCSPLSRRAACGKSVSERHQSRLSSVSPCPAPHRHPLLALQPVLSAAWCSLTSRSKTYSDGDLCLSWTYLQAGGAIELQLNRQKLVMDSWPSKKDRGVARTKPDKAKALRSPAQKVQSPSHPCPISPGTLCQISRGLLPCSPRR
jgi:hypothetical protein